jgi:hypothetical protein
LRITLDPLDRRGLSTQIVGCCKFFIHLISRLETAGRSVALFRLLRASVQIAPSDSQCVWMSGVAAQLSNVQPDDPVVLIISFFCVV